MYDPRTHISTLLTSCALSLLFAAPLAADGWPVPCDRTRTPALRAAVQAAEAYFDARWLRLSNAARATAFESRPEPVSPLAPRKVDDGPPGAAVRGYVLVAGIACFATEQAGETLVEFQGQSIRFHEPATGWSRPFASGLLMAVGVSTVDGAPRAQPKEDFATLILPDASLRKPTASELPAVARTGGTRRP